MSAFGGKADIAVQSIFLTGVGTGVVDIRIFKLLTSRRNVSFLAEGVRFELTRELAPPAGFQDRCLKPLGHPS
jgi:hypothetical protein